MAVSSLECQSMRLLARDGWSSGELAMTMQVCRSGTIRHHVMGQCSHTHSTPHLDEWDGKTAPERLSAGDRGGEVNA